MQNRIIIFASFLFFFLAVSSEAADVAKIGVVDFQKIIQNSSAGKAAQAKKEIYEAKAKIGTNKTTDLIDRMKAKAERVSYEAAAAEEIADEATGDSLEKEFQDLGDGVAGQSVQDKLAALKAKLQ